MKHLKYEIFSQGSWSANCRYLPYYRETTRDDYTDTVYSLLVVFIPDWWDYIQCSPENLEQEAFIYLFSLSPHLLKIYSFLLYYILITFSPFSSFPFPYSCLSLASGIACWLGLNSVLPSNPGWSQTHDPPLSASQC